MLLKFFSLLNIIYSGNSHENILLGGEHDENGCLTSAGFSWCSHSNNCVRHWETPCSDYFTSCNDCLSKQNNGMNIACPDSCIPEVIYDPLPPLLYSPPAPPPPPCSIPYEDCAGEYVCPKITEITQCSEGGIDGYTTYQLSLVVKHHNVKNIYAIYGNDEHGGDLMTIPPAFQIDNSFGSDIGGTNPYFLTYDPDIEFDSWLTIGITNGDPHNKLSTIGIDFTKWDEETPLQIGNGAVFVMDPEEVIVTGNEYIIAQLTIPNTESYTVIVNAQGKNINIRDVERWKQENIIFYLDRQSDIKPNLNNLLPTNCIIWFDGCNSCQVSNGHTGVCTEMACENLKEPHCLRFSNGH